MDKNLTNWVLSCVGMMHCYGLPANPYPLLSKRDEKCSIFRPREAKIRSFLEAFFRVDVPKSKDPLKVKDYRF